MQIGSKNINPFHIIQESFEIYLKTFSFQLLYSFLYFSLYFIGTSIAIDQLNLSGEINNLSNLLFKNPEGFIKTAKTLGENDAFAWFTIALVGIKTLLYPLQIGLLQVINKEYSLQKSSFQDLIIAYSGSTFFIFISFASFFCFTELFLKNLIIFPAYFWIIVMIFVGPLMFFHQMPMFGAMQYSFKLCIKHFWSISLCLFLGFVISWVGLSFFFIGALFTFSFQLCVVSTLYRNLALQKEI